jgi:hypothetical protein
VSCLGVSGKVPDTTAFRAAGRGFGFVVAGLVVAEDFPDAFFGFVMAEVFFGFVGDLVTLYTTASFTAFTGLARTALLAGLAANFCFCLVKGLIPSRAGRAGFLWTVNFASP